MEDDTRHELTTAGHFSLVGRKFQGYYVTPSHWTMRDGWPCIAWPVTTYAELHFLVGTLHQELDQLLAQAVAHTSTLYGTRDARHLAPLGPRTAPAQQSGLALRFSILKRDGYRCQICGRSAADGVVLEVDHRIPRSRGGPDDPNNLWTLCFDCNRGKRDYDL